eukprot:6352939-Pyramimonas_sp.AAC.1
MSMPNSPSIDSLPPQVKKDMTSEDIMAQSGLLHGLKDLPTSHSQDSLSPFRAPSHVSCSQKPADLLTQSVAKNVKAGGILMATSNASPNKADAAQRGQVQGLELHGSRLRELGGWRPAQNARASTQGGSEEGSDVNGIKPIGDPVDIYFPLDLALMLRLTSIYRWHMLGAQLPARGSGLKRFCRKFRRQKITYTTAALTCPAVLYNSPAVLYKSPAVLYKSPAV